MSGERVSLRFTMDKPHSGKVELISPDGKSLGVIPCAAIRFELGPEAENGRLHIEVPGFLVKGDIAIALEQCEVQLLPPRQSDLDEWKAEMS